MRVRSRLLVVSLSCVLAGTVPALVGGADPGGPDEGGPPDARAQLAGSSQDDSGRRPDSSTKPRQTSEGIRGERAEPIPAGRVGRPVVSRQKSWRVAPGVHYRRWDQSDRRGPIRAHLLTVNPEKPGLVVDYAAGKYVPERATLTQLLARDQAIAGVNGGFFDISDTGAPLGVGRDRERGMLHASRYTWNNAFSMNRDGAVRIGKLRMTAEIPQWPQLHITNVNSPRVRVAGIGIYAHAWGRTSGYRITDGQTKHVRMVVIEDGRVIANKTRLSSNRKIRDQVVLVGRGPSAYAMRQMRVGSTATVDWALSGTPSMAISGEKVLLRKGERKVENDVALHPRTAIGIDRDKDHLLLLVVDGRQSFSRGYTLVELARMMKKLGAEDALNLDGGGSSTMVGAGRGGLVKVLNSPSDGSQRRIADGISVRYRPPAG